MTRSVKTFVLGITQPTRQQSGRPPNLPTPTNSSIGSRHYDTVIGERGFTLSGGQRQRLRSARALLRDADLLIFDEATGALDTASEQIIQNALKENLRDKTVLVVAHRLSTISHADQIVVLEHGRILEQGSHVELLARNGKYTQLWESQSRAPVGQALSPPDEDRASC